MGLDWANRILGQANWALGQANRALGQAKKSRVDKTALRAILFFAYPSQNPGDAPWYGPQRLGKEGGIGCEVGGKRMGIGERVGWGIEYIEGRSINLREETPKQKFAL